MILPHCLDPHLKAVRLTLAVDQQSVTGLSSEK